MSHPQTATQSSIAEFCHRVADNRQHADSLAVSPGFCDMLDVHFERIKHSAPPRAFSRPHRVCHMADQDMKVTGLPLSTDLGSVLAPPGPRALGSGTIFKIRLPPSSFRYLFGCRSRLSHWWILSQVSVAQACS